MRSPLATQILASLVIGWLGGCGSSTSKNDVPETPAPAASDAPANVPTIVYAKSRLEGDRLIVDVIARGAADIHGAAFRVHWDTAKLSFVDAVGSDAWSRQALRLAKEGVPGELVVTWTEKGQTTETRAAIDAREDTRLGTLTFATKSALETSSDQAMALVMFRNERSVLLDSRGNRIAVAWRDRPLGE